MSTKTQDKIFIVFIGIMLLSTVIALYYINSINYTAIIGL